MDLKLMTCGIVYLILYNDKCYKCTLNFFFASKCDLHFPVYKNMYTENRKRKKATL